MLGIPAQTYRDLEAAARLPVNHFSAYMFEYEHTLPDDETAELYLRAVELLPEQYEISNFGVPCKHNLKYWRCEEYIGVGASAHSYYGGKRYANSRGGERYVTEESPGGYEERVMLGLRLTEGIEADCALLERVKAIPAEYVSVNGKNLALTPRGFLIANRIIGELLG
jgi:oxygen-independent coproporphyrinogen-3 oxidase